MEPDETLDINKLANGAIQEAIHFALGECFENIKDPNTEAEKVRKLTMTIDLKPDETRQIIKTKVSCKTKLVPVNSITTQLLLDKSGDKVVATELLKHNPNQIGFDELQENNNVINMDKGVK